MLVLARKKRQAVVVAASEHLEELVRVTVIEVCGNRVKLGFQAGPEIAIHREEIWERVRAERQLVQHTACVES